MVSYHVWISHAMENWPKVQGDLELVISLVAFVQRSYQMIYLLYTLIK